MLFDQLIIDFAICRPVAFVSLYAGHTLSINSDNLQVSDYPSL